MKKLIVTVLAVPLLLLAIFYSAGLALPSEGERTTSAHLSKSPGIIWKVWTTHVNERVLDPLFLIKAEVLPFQRWKVTYCQEVKTQNSCGQIMEVEMEPLNSGTKLTITEKWKNENPLDKLFKYSQLNYRSHMARFYKNLEDEANAVASAKGVGSPNL